MQRLVSRVMVVQAMSIFWEGWMSGHLSWQKLKQCTVCTHFLTKLSDSYHGCSLHFIPLSVTLTLVIWTLQLLPEWGQVCRWCKPVQLPVCPGLHWFKLPTPHQPLRLQPLPQWGVLLQPADLLLLLLSLRIYWPSLWGEIILAEWHCFDMWVAILLFWPCFEIYYFDLAVRGDTMLFWPHCSEMRCYFDLTAVR